MKINIHTKKIQDIFIFMYFHKNYKQYKYLKDQQKNSGFAIETHLQLSRNYRE